MTIIPADIRIEDHGSIVLLVPMTDHGRDWCEEHIGEENGFQPYWPQVVVERRYVGDILAGMHEDGLTIEERS